MPEQPSTSSLIEYISAAKTHGASDAFLADMLERSGWPRKEVYAAFNTVYSRLTGLEVPRA